MTAYISVLWTKVLAVAFFAGTVARAPDALQERQASDAALTSAPATISLTYSSPVSGMIPIFGMMAQRGQLIAGAQARGLALDAARYEEPIRYIGKGIGGLDAIDFDTDGSLAVWRPEAEFMLHTADFNQIADRRTITLIGPNDVLVSQYSSQRLRVFQPGDEQSTFKYDRVWLAAGRNWWSFVDQIKSETAQADGLIVAEASGHYGNLTGNWTITFDPKAGGMVRRAAFTRDDPREPLLVGETSGTAWYGGTAFPTDGSVTFFPGQSREHRTTVNFARYTSGVDRDVLLRLYALTNPARQQLDEVMDYTAGDGAPPIRIMTDETESGK